MSMSISCGGCDLEYAGGRGVSGVLPAVRTDITLHTSDGLELVGELAVPQDRPPVATLVCLHPLPTAEGMMDSHVLRKASYRLPALAGLAVLRFNTRGTSSDRGTSEGEFGGGDSERSHLRPRATHHAPVLGDAHDHMPGQAAARAGEHQKRAAPPAKAEADASAEINDVSLTAFARTAAAAEALNDLFS